MLGIGPPRTENHYVSRTAPLRFVEPASLSSGVGSGIGSDRWRMMTKAKFRLGARELANMRGVTTGGGD